MIIVSRRLLFLFVITILLPAASSARSPDLERWRCITTPNFTLYTDAELERGLQVAAQLEQFRSAFSALAPALELRSPSPTTLYAFRDATSFDPYKSRPDSGGARILGQFTKTRDGNYLSLDAGASLAGSFAVIYHEYVHFLVLHNFPRVPLWFNEGLAEYYSTFAVQNGKAVLGEPVKRHVQWLRRFGDFSLQELLEADTESAAYHEPSEVGRFYALSWALVHYLLSGGPTEIDRAVDYFIRLRTGDDPSLAFESAFGRRLESMERELRTYLETGNFATTRVRLPELDLSGFAVRPSQPAETLYRLGDLAVHMGKNRLAERHFQAALDRQPNHADTHAGLALVRNVQERWREADVLYKDAVRLKAKLPVSYLLYGRHSIVGAQVAQRRSGQAKKAEKRANAARASLAKAIQLSPSFGEAHALLAAAQLLPGGDEDKALESIFQARDLLPSRIDLVELEIRIQLKRGELDEAERLIVGELEPRVSDFERVNKAWEDLQRTDLLKRSEEAFDAGENDRGLELLDEAVELTTDPALREHLEAELLRLQDEAG